MEDLEARKQRLAALTGGDKPSPAGRSKADLARRRRRLSQTAGLQTQQSREKEVSVATSGTGGSLPTDRTYNLGKCTKRDCPHGQHVCNIVLKGGRVCGFRNHTAKECTDRRALPRTAK